MERWKFNYLSALAALYVISFVLLTVGYFTPWWVRRYHRDIPGRPYEPEECDTAGLISGHCRYPFHDLSKHKWHIGLILRLCFYFMLAAMILVYTNARMVLATFLLKMYRQEAFMSYYCCYFSGLILRLCFYFMLAAMILVYTNALMVLATFFLKMYRREVFMSFLGISCGVLYPVAGLLVVVSSLFVICTYPKESGFSVFCCLTAGVFNIFCYVGLRVYDYRYTSTRNRKKAINDQKLSK